MKILFNPLIIQGADLKIDVKSREPTDLKYPTSEKIACVRK